MIPMSTLRDLCDAPQEAVRIIREGGVAIVAGAGEWQVAGAQARGGAQRG